LIVIKGSLCGKKGFRNSELLGVGGFWKLYEGALSKAHAQIVVKRISHDSRQGMKEFMAEIACQGYGTETWCSS